jgi:hypothetical protein
VKSEGAALWCFAATKILFRGAPTNFAANLLPLLRRITGSESNDARKKFLTFDEKFAQ